MHKKLSLSSNLQSLHKYVVHKKVPNDILNALDIITYERTIIEEEVIKGGKQVYGFITLLGPNDDVSITSADQQELLEAHCVGIPEELDPLIASSILGVKLIQLSNGGSGISTEAYSWLLRIASADNIVIRADLDASYGSGDVVPGAWFTSSVFPKNYVWEPGDVIALISGNYISTALLYVVLTRFIECYASFLGAVSNHILSPVTVGGEKFFDGKPDNLFKERGAWNDPPQLPVSIRDSQPFLQAGERVMLDMLEILNMSLSQFTGNPIFVSDENGLHCYSQSSFLNFSAKSCLQNAHDVLSIISSYLQRVTEYLSENIREESNRTNYQALKAVQAPKVSEAIRINIQSRVLPNNLSGSMPGGVEDIWDNSLMSSKIVLESIVLVHKQIQILRHMIEDRSEGHTVISDSLWDYVLSH